MQKSALAFILIGILVVLNVLLIGVSGWRVDLTRDKAFTLAEATTETLEKLENPVTITAYFTDNLPAPFSDNARYARDLLAEMRAASGGQLSFEFLDPQSQETEEDREKKKEVKRDIFGRTVREKTSVETELETLGIQPVEVRVFEEDEAKTMRAYMGLAVRYGEDKEAVPVIQDVSMLEYDLTSIIRRLVRQKTPTVGVVQGHGEPDLQSEMDKVINMLKLNYDMKPVKLDEGKVPDDVDVLLVVGPQQAFADAELKAIDGWLMQGKSAAFFLDRVSVDLKTFQPTPNAQNLEALVGAYGIELGSQLVGDVTCASLNVSERRGFMVIQMPKPYPFIPQVKQLEGESALAKGIADVALPFAVPVYPKTDLPGVTVEVLAKSSVKSWLEDGTPENLSPVRDWGTATVGFTGPYNLVATARGALPSFADPQQKSAREARVIVAGSSTMFNEAVLSPQNAALLLNMIDWLSLDAKLLDMRARSLSEAPIDPNLSPGTKTLVKAGNVITAVLLDGIFAAVLLLRRRSRRNALAVATPN